MPANCPAQVLAPRARQSEAGGKGAGIRGDKVEGQASGSTIFGCESLTNTGAVGRLQGTLISDDESNPIGSLEIRRCKAREARRCRGRIALAWCSPPRSPRVSCRRSSQASPRAIARLTGVQGNVLVSQADGMAAAVERAAAARPARGSSRRPARRSRLPTSADVSWISARTGGTSCARRRSARSPRRRRWAPPRRSPFSRVPQVVNSGGSVIRGDLGVSPGTGVTGFPGGKVVDGTIQTTGDAPNLAQKDAAKAYADLASQQCNVRLSGQDLGGQTLTPGVYCFPAAAGHADRRARAGRPGRSRRGLRLPGRNHADDGGQVVGARRQQRSAGRRGAPGADRARRARLALPRLLAGRRFGRASAGTAPSSAPSSRQRGIGVAANAAIDGRALARTAAVTLDTNAVEMPLCVAAVAFLPVERCALRSVGIAAAGVVTYEVAEERQEIEKSELTSPSKLEALRHVEPAGSMFFCCFAAFLLLAPLYKAGNRPLPLLLLELAAIGFLFVIVAVHRAPLGLPRTLTVGDRRAARLSAGAARPAAGCAVAGAARARRVRRGARSVRGRRRPQAHGARSR